MEHKQTKRRTLVSGIIACVVALGAALKAASDPASAAWSANQIRRLVPELSGAIGSERTWQAAIVVAIVGVLLLHARQRARDRIDDAVGEHGLLLVRGFGLLALVIALYMAVLSQTGFQHTHAPVLPGIRAEVAQRSTGYPGSTPPAAKPSKSQQPSTPGPARSPTTSDISAETKSSHVCSPCAQGHGPQTGEAPGGGEPAPEAEEAVPHANAATIKEEVASSTATKTEVPGGSSTASGNGSSTVETSGVGITSSQSEQQSSSSSSSSSSDGASTFQAQSQSQQSSASSTTTGTPPG